MQNIEKKNKFKEKKVNPKKRIKFCYESGKIKQKFIDGFLD